METFNYRDIDFSSMKLSDIQGTTSSVYIDGDTCFKILDDLYPMERLKLLEKFKEMDGISIDGILLPRGLILDDGLLMGYTMDYFSNSMNLYDYFGKERFVDINEIFKAVKKTSLLVRKAHENGILLQDFSFDNILMDDNSNIKISDIDGCCFNGIESPFISYIMRYYYYVLMKRNHRVNKNFDNQSLLLSMLLAIYHNSKLSMSVYDTLSDKVQTLKNMRKLINNLLNDSDTKVPYLDEIILDDDHFMIDRDTQISREKVLAKDYSIF